MSNYEDSGFDGFLSRSVDDIAQVNLSAPGPVSREVPFDRGSVSGQIPDVLRIGDRIFLDGRAGNIILNDGVNDFCLIGDDGTGN